MPIAAAPDDSHCMIALAAVLVQYAEIGFVSRNYNPVELSVTRANRAVCNRDALRPPDVA